MDVIITAEEKKWNSNSKRLSENKKRLTIIIDIEAMRELKFEHRSLCKFESWIENHYQNSKSDSSNSSKNCWNYIRTKSSEVLNHAIKWKYHSCGSNSGSLSTCLIPFSVNDNLTHPRVFLFSLFFCVTVRKSIERCFSVLLLLFSSIKNMKHFMLML